MRFILISYPDDCSQQSEQGSRWNWISHPRETKRNGLDALPAGVCVIGDVTAAAAAARW